MCLFRLFLVYAAFCLDKAEETFFCSTVLFYYIIYTSQQACIFVSVDVSIDFTRNNILTCLAC